MRVVYCLRHDVTANACRHQVVTAKTKRNIYRLLLSSSGCCCLHQEVTAKTKRNIYRLLLSSSGCCCLHQEVTANTKRNIIIQVVAVFVRRSLQTPRGIYAGCYCGHQVKRSSGGHCRRQEEYIQVVVFIRLLLPSSGGHCEYQVVIVVIFILLSSSGGH